MPRSSRTACRFVLLCLVLQLGTSALAAQETYRPLAPGVDYRHDVRAVGPLSIHVVRIDRQEGRWELHAGLAQGTVFGLEPLDRIVARMEAILHKPAIAAINGDFFVIQPGPYQGDPRGIQITEGELVSAPRGNAFWVAANGTPHMGPVASKLRVVWPGRNVETAIGLNEARGDDAVVLYTPTLGLPAAKASPGPPSTRTRGGKELAIEHIMGQPWLPVTVGMNCLAKILEVRDGGNTPLSPSRMILSIGPKKLAGLPPIKPGDSLQLVVQTEPDLRGVTTAIGAGRILIQAGKSPDVGPANQPRHPRSMLGWNERYLYFVVIDGRQPKLSIGMSYPEMARLAKEYTCANAIELDGGGSSTLWATGKTWNSPSDGKLRAIANGLILFRGSP